MVEQEMNEVFHALSDPTRRGMLRKLAEGSCSISELAAPYLMSFAAASKHVQVLERANLVSRSIQGRTHICSLNKEPILQAAEWLQSYRAAA